MTELDSLRQEGAFKARLPMVEPSMNGFMEVILINTAGGLTGGDNMALRFEAGVNTKNTITTQAFEKYYNASDGVSSVRNEIVLESGSDLRWLPQETILYNRSNVRRHTHVQMAHDANLLFAETVVLGRLTRNECFADGAFSDEWRIVVGDRLVHREAIALQPGPSQRLQNRAILNGGAVFSTVIGIGDLYVKRYEGLRAAMSESKLFGGVSAWRVGGVNKVIIRLIAQSSLEMRKLLVPILTRLCGDAPLPRAWSI